MTNVSSSSNPYQVQGAGVPAMLGRRELFRRLLDLVVDDGGQHVSVVGPPLYGKSVLLNHLRAHLRRPENPPHAIAVYWDLARDVPATDAEFRWKFAVRLGASLSAAKVEIPQLENALTDPDGTEALVGHELLETVFDQLARSGVRVVAILDSIDDILPDPALTRTFWNDMHRLGDLSSLRYVTGSRARLHSMVRARPAEHPPVRIHQLFYPEELEVGPFSDEDWIDFVSGLPEELVGNARAVEAIETWTGRVPMLAAALADRLVRGAAGTAGDYRAYVEETAGEMVTDRGANDAIRRFYHAWPDEQKPVLARLATGSTRTSEKVTHYLERFGLAEVRGGVLTSSCRFITTFAGRQRAETGLQYLFDDPTDYEDNMITVLKVRLDHLKDRAHVLQGQRPSHIQRQYGKIAGAIDVAITQLRHGNGRSALGSARNIAKEAMALILMMECNVMRLQQIGDIDIEGTFTAGNMSGKKWPTVTVEQLRQREWFALKAIRIAAGLERWPKQESPPWSGQFQQTTTHVGRASVSALDGLWQAGNLGQHAGDVPIPVTMAIPVVQRAIEMYGALREDVLRRGSR